MGKGNPAKGRVFLLLIGRGAAVYSQDDSQTWVGCDERNSRRIAWAVVGTDVSGVRHSWLIQPARAESEAYLTENPLPRQQFGAQADYEAKHC